MVQYFCKGWITYCSIITVLFLQSSISTACEGTGTIVPLYLYPQRVNGVHNWQPLIDAYSNYSIPTWAIVNVYNGPGTNLDSNYKSSIDMLKSSGIGTLGYVATNYGKRNKVTVKQEIDKWKSMYAPKGIFFDEMSASTNNSYVKYYSELKNYTQEKGFTYTVGNPGTDVPRGYVNSVDTIMIYETGGSFPTVDQYCGWHTEYPKKNWGIFPYNLTLNPNREKILAAKNCVGFIYITDDGGDNPWDTLPPYLQDLFSLLKL